MDDDLEIIHEFLVESYENMNQLDQDLVELEDRPRDVDLLSQIFRTVHTIKGTAGFLAFETLERVTHVGENLLVALRDGELVMNAHIASALLQLVDATREILGRIESTQQEGDETYDSLVATLTALRQGEVPTDAISGDAAESVEPDVEDTSTQEAVVVEHLETVAPAEGSTAVEATPLVETPAEQTAVEPIAVDKVKPGDNTAKQESNGEASGGSSVADTTVRIEVDLLDKLMNLVGELVLARNQVIQYSSTTDDSGMTAASQRLNHITAELQEGVMKTRMQPIRNVWGRMPRVVRDLARECTKQVRVVTTGGDTELDKTILEAIKDPLTHIVRNAVDHGIEPADVRTAAGKNPEGELSLRAWHEGGQVNIEVADDGGGLNIPRIREKAVEKGLVTAAAAEAMSDRDAMQLILLPGFSTAAAVTNVSGRGVGMDVVKTNVEQIGGTLELHSEPGVGTSLRIRIPLTLAIVPAMIVSASEQRYCIPQVGLQELVRLEQREGEPWIEHVHSAPVYRLRERLLPLIYLDEVLGEHPARSKDEQLSAETINIVVLEAEGHPFGLVVDSIDDTQEIVVKGLSGRLQSVDLYAGATIMGDGSVVLILDACGLARTTNVLKDSARVAKYADDAVTTEKGSQIESLLVESGDGRRVAVPLDSVERLEEFGLDDIEWLDDRAVVKYRGTVMPVIPVGRFSQDKAERRPVIVTRKNGQQVGYVVKQIVDVVRHEAFDDQEGLQIIDGAVTRVLDLQTA